MERSYILQAPLCHKEIARISDLIWDHSSAPLYLRSCRCLIITAHLLIRAPYLTNVLVTASQCKKEGGEKLRPNLISYYHNCTIITVRPHQHLYQCTFYIRPNNCMCEPGRGFTLANPTQLIILNIVLLY